MKIKDIMTPHPACCSPVANLKEVAQMMLASDCGEIPVIENINNLKLIGVVTDRDIVCRTIAIGKNPLEMTAVECMSKPRVTFDIEAKVEDCWRMLKKNCIQRVPVVDEQGRCCGIVAKADFVTHHLYEEASDVLQMDFQRH